MKSDKVRNHQWLIKFPSGFIQKKNSAKLLVNTQENELKITVAFSWVVDHSWRPVAHIMLHIHANCHSSNIVLTETRKIFQQDESVREMTKYFSDYRRRIKDSTIHQIAQVVWFHFLQPKNPDCTNENKTKKKEVGQNLPKKMFENEGFFFFFLSFFLSLSQPKLG